ncbi:MAG TPA: phosphatase PAP2 family protein [Acidimicrobiales bacterium]|nr:phosphatase PAP2 family protein [Acidimicrobiales bacterium]
MLASARRAVGRFDAAVDARLVRLRGHRALDRLMYGASELGDWSLVWHLVGLSQALLPGREPLSAVRLSLILGVESIVVNGGVKQLFRRVRPEWISEDPRPHRLRQPRTSSFPSGHASSAFTAAGVLAAGGDPLWPLYYAIAVVVASSRAYVRIHHASDVIAGAALGVGLAALANQLWPAIT